MRNWALKNDKTNLNTHYRAKHSSCWINMWLTLSCNSVFTVLRFVENWVCSHCRHTNKPKPTFMQSEFPRMSYISVLFHPFIQLFVHFFLFSNKSELIRMSVGPQVLWLHRYILAASVNTILQTIVGAPTRVV